MSYNPYSLENKTILITGASSGIGKATAIESSKLGAKVVITGRNEERLNETYINLDGDGHIKIIADVSTDEGLDTIINNCPFVDGFVNNAGIIKTIPIQFITREKIDELMSVNLDSMILLFAKLLKKKKLPKGSSVVFTSSIGGTKVGTIGNSLYDSSKAAISGFIKTSAIELAPKNIRVNCVCPGMINTNLFNEGAVTEQQFQEDSKKYPLGRYGNPEEVAWAIIYLLSNASSFITGSELVIDGGFSIK